MRTLSTILMLACFLPVFTGCAGGSDPTGPAKSIDSSPPAAPTSFQAAAGSSVVKLTWAANTTDSDLLGYNVYRMIDGRMILLNSVPLGTNQYFDHNPWPVTSAYAVTSLDEAGNESAVQTVVFVPSPAQPERDAG